VGVDIPSGTGDVLQIQTRPGRRLRKRPPQGRRRRLRHGAARGGTRARVEPYAEAFRTYADAGYDHLVFMDAGPGQDGFLDFFAEELRPSLG
jgi:hypothetical protein